MSEGLYQKDASPCRCGFSTSYPDCNGTHKIVKQLREQIAQDIEAIEVGSSNGVGMKSLAAEVARGKAIIVHKKEDK